MSDEEKGGKFKLSDRDDQEAEGQQLVGFLAKLATDLGVQVTDLVESLRIVLVAGMNRNNKDH